MKPSPKKSVTVDEHLAFKREILAVEMLVPDYQRGAIQSRPTHEVSALLQILDDIQVETLRENSFESEAAQ